MPSVFAGAQTYKGGFRADQLRMNFKGDPVDGFLIQNVSFQYQQQISMLYEIGSANVYYVGGRAQGQATLSRVIGPTALAGRFISLFNDLCSPGDFSFDASHGCPVGGGNINGGNGSVNYTLKSAVLTTISLSVQAQDVVINEQLQFIFVDLQTAGQ